MAVEFCFEVVEAVTGLRKQRVKAGNVVGFGAETGDFHRSEGYVRNINRDSISKVGELTSISS